MRPSRTTARVTSASASYRAFISLANVRAFFFGVDSRRASGVDVCGSRQRGVVEVVYCRAL
eukprot:5300924-Prymnesium_polylepis.2